MGSSEDDNRSARLANVAFDAALGDMASNDGSIEGLIAAFEDAAHQDEDGVEYWCARALQQLLGYERWDTFLQAIERAKLACAKSGQPIEHHFSDVRKMVAIGSGAEREIDDVHVTRYGCYLIAQNGDPRKKPVAFAQTYFAIQTRRQEIHDQDKREYDPLSEDQKRVMLRDEIKEHNKMLASAAKMSGVIEPIDFAIFQTFGYKGLYGGLDRVGIQHKKGLRAKQQILDHMGSTELAANLFRATQTEDKLRRDRVKGKDAANQVHYDVGAKVRATIRDIGGTMPENLPPEEDIKKIERRLKKLGKVQSKKPLASD